MVSTHNWVIPYTQDPVFSVDLLDESVEPEWGTQDHEQIDTAPADARAFPETTHKHGAYQRYAFSFLCKDVDTLRQSLANGEAAFRWDSNDGGLLAMDFGFNRRSGGPELRPRLVLYTANDPTGSTTTCDPNTPAPTITDVGVHDGTTENSATVSWETDVPSDSTVLFREKSAPKKTPWTQVGTPALTKVHHVQVFGISPDKEYVFAVRSAACNGATATDSNAGKGYDFFYPPLLGTQRWFEGEAPDATWSDTEPTGEPPSQQHATAASDPNTPEDPFAIYWSGEVPDNPAGGADIPAGSEMSFDWYFSSRFGNVFITTAEIGIWTGDPWQRVHFQEIDLDVFGSAAPVLNEHTITLQGDVNDRMLIQLTTPFINNDFTAYYGAASTPSRWAVPLGGGPPEGLPRTGPVPPPSANASNLELPAPSGKPSDADIRAGTMNCAPKPPCPRGKGKANVIVGTDGRDRLKGTRKKDVICGLGGRDKLIGKRGKDRIYGGKGRDKLNGGPQNDRLRGQGGKDRLRGAGGKKDRCSGGPGKDRGKSCERGKI
jgi:hypothetical protein